jgi:RNA polymerase sigma-70 factor (ECF subfamily)
MSAPEGSLSSAERERWLQAARNGSQSALGRLLESYRPYLLMVANHELDPALAVKMAPSDLVQETFLKASGDFAQFRGRSEDEFQAWLRRILLNALVDVSRHYQGTEKCAIGREVALPDTPLAQLRNGILDPADSPHSQLAARERDEALQAALGRLPDEARQMIRWRNYELLPFEEIGRRLGRSAEAARKQWARAVEQLKQLLEAGHESR